MKFPFKKPEQRKTPAESSAISPEEALAKSKQAVQYLLTFLQYASNSAPLASFLQDFLESTQQFLSAQGYAFWQYHPFSREFILTFSSRDFPQLQVLKEEQNVYLLRKLFSSKTAVEIQKVPEFAPLLQNTSFENGYIALLRKDVQTFGFWAIFHPESPSASDFQLITDLLIQLLEHQWLRERNEFSGKHREFLRNISLLVASGLDLEDCIQQTLEEIRSFVGARAITLELLATEPAAEGSVRHILKLHSQTGLNSAQFWSPTSPSPSQEVFQQGKPLIFDLTQFPELDASIQEFRACLGIPIYAGGNFIGVLSAFSPNPVLFPNLNELLDPVASLLANFLEQSRYFQEAKEKREELSQLRQHLLTFQRELEGLHREKQVLEHLRKEWLFSLGKELKVPLTVLQGAISLILKKPTDPDFPQLMEKGLFQLASFVQEISLLSEIEAGEIHLNPKQISLQTLISQTVSIAESRARDKAVHIILNWDLQEERIFVDEQKTQTALSILLDYLINTAPFHTNITVAAEKVEGQAISSLEGLSHIPYLCLSFQAESEPPSKEEIVRLFHKYTLKGMYISKYLLEQQGCHLQFCAGQKGALIQVFFPLLKEKQEQNPVQIEEIIAMEPTNLPLENVPSPWRITTARRIQDVSASSVDLIVYPGSLDKMFWEFQNIATQKKWRSSILLLPAKPLSVRNYNAGVLSVSHRSITLPRMWNQVIITHPRELFAWCEFPSSFDVLLVLDFPLSPEVVQSLNRLLSSGTAVTFTVLERTLPILEFLDWVFSRIYVRI